MTEIRSPGIAEEIEIPAEVEPPPWDLLGAVEAGKIVMSCDLPGNDFTGGRLPLPIRIAGWAYSRPGVRTVAVTIDDQRFRCSYGLLRSDVAAVLGEQQAANSGYGLTIDEVHCPPGPHRLCVIAIDGAGQATGVAMDIVAEHPPEAEGPPGPLGRPLARPLQRLDNGGERYVPELHRGGLIEVEHETRYTWAATLAGGREVLDAGCGVGWGTGRLLEAGATRAVGLDIDSAAIDSAALRAPEAEFVRGDLMELPFEAASFDLVVSFEAIEHVTDPQRALDEMRRVLRPGGWLVISSPNRGVYPAGNPFHVSELSSDELELSLCSRFEHVTLYRQRDHIASLLTDDRGFGTEGPTVPIEAVVRKLSGGAPGEETYTVAVAGDQPPPAMPGLAFLAEPLDILPLMERMGLLEHRALVAEAELSASHGEVNTLTFARDRALVLLKETELRRAQLEQELTSAQAGRASAERLLADHRASVSWRLTTPLRASKRALAAYRAGRSR